MEPYVIGCHGCSPDRLGQNEETEFKPSRYFIVPKNMMIVYLTANGVQSEGRKNIPFIKNLYDYDRNLFNYIFNPHNYAINLDKTNKNSYRHKDFFKSLPFYSDFNYLCNFELYPAGVHCPKVILSFTNNSESTGKSSYFEGVTRLTNINFEKYAEKLEFTGPVFDPLSVGDVKNAGGFIYTDHLMNVLNHYAKLNKGIFFISACRVDHFIKDGNPTMVDIHPITRNCQGIEYDNNIVDDLIKKYPLQKLPLENLKNRLNIRNKAKIDIDKEIYSQYQQSNNYYTTEYKNFILEIYKLLYNLSLDLPSIKNIEKNLCINFKKIKISNSDIQNYQTLPNENYYILLMNKIFYKIRENLLNLHQNLQENKNIILYNKLGHFNNFLLTYIQQYNILPSNNHLFIYIGILDNISDNDWIQITNVTKDDIAERITRQVNHMINNTFVLKLKYLKYKQKYLQLKNKN
jgi:hypothetical protein